MPGLGALFAKAPEGPQRIPADPVVALGHAVYYVPGYPPLGGHELRRQLPVWLEEHVEEPLRGALRHFAAGPGLTYTDDLQRGALPLPPYDLLRAEGAGAEDLRRIENGYQLVMISARDSNQVPRFGLWAALAGALAAADLLQGVAYDPARLAVLGGKLEEPSPVRLAGDGVLRIGEHISVRSRVDPAGTGRAATAGMSKFGLPELRMGFTAGAEPPLSILVACAQQVLDAVLSANHGRDQCLSKVEWGPEVEANGLPLLVRHTPGTDGGRGWLEVASRAVSR